MQADSPATYDAITDDVGAVSLAVDRTAITRFPVADDYHDDDAPRCPPPILPIEIISSWCSASSGFSTAHRCQTDGDCQSSLSSSTSGRKRKCCHNGCRRVCAVPIDPAPCESPKSYRHCYIVPLFYRLLHCWFRCSFRVFSSLQNCSCITVRFSCLFIVQLHVKRN